MLHSLLQRLSGGGRQRTSGPPTSSNRASSCHLLWDVPPHPAVEVAATIEVTEPPIVDRLYFWALQVSFANSAGLRSGGAHFGLQHHPSYPANGAVNWGGYASRGGELEGSVSALPSALDNVNTRTYHWLPHRRYRYRIHRSPERGWRGTITDLETGEDTIVRDLWVDGDHLVSPVVWTEAFADCGDRPAAVRWTDLQLLTAEGKRFTIDRVRVNYQSYRDGGCTNSDCSCDGSGFVQRTGTERITPAGAPLQLRP